jgi:hypothetical protein
MKWTVMDAARAAAARPTYKELKDENDRLREALEKCKEHVRISYGSWWNNPTARDLMTEYINPALGLDPWG